MYRTHHCGQLNISNEGETVTLSGWVQKSRDLGGMTFVDLRDRYGITQLVFNMESNASLCREARKLGREYVVKATGKVAERKGGIGTQGNQPETEPVEVEAGLSLKFQLGQHPRVVRNEYRIPAAEPKLARVWRRLRQLRQGVSLDRSPEGAVWLRLRGELRESDAARLLARELRVDGVDLLAQPLVAIRVRLGLEIGELNPENAGGVEVAAIPGELVGVQQDHPDLNLAPGADVTSVTSSVSVVPGVMLFSGLPSPVVATTE